MKRKSKKERLAIAKKARTTHKRNIKAKISSLEDSLEKASWKIYWVSDALKSNNEEYIAIVKEEIDYRPNTIASLNGLTSGILPFLNRKLRDNFFAEPKQYSFEWWLIETGRKEKRPDWNEVFTNNIRSQAK